MQPTLRCWRGEARLKVGRIVRPGTQTHGDQPHRWHQFHAWDHSHTAHIKIQWDSQQIDLQFYGAHLYLDYVYPPEIFWSVLIALLQILARISGIGTPPSRAFYLAIKQLVHRTYDAGETTFAFPSVSDNRNSPEQCWLHSTSLIVNNRINWRHFPLDPTII